MASRQTSFTLMATITMTLVGAVISNYFHRQKLLAGSRLDLTINIATTTQTSNSGIILSVFNQGMLTHSSFFVIYYFSQGTFQDFVLKVSANWK